MSNNLDLQSVVSETIELVKTKWQPMLIAVLLYFVTLIPAIIPFIGMVYALVVGGPLLAGLMYTINQIRKGEETKASDIYKGFSSFGKAFCVMLLFNLMVTIGSLFFIVPGIILAAGFFPCMFLILDADFGIMDTFNKAWEITKGKKMSIFVNVLIFTLLVFVIEIVFMLIFMLLSFIPILGPIIGFILGFVLCVAVGLAGVGIYSVLYGRLEEPEAELGEPEVAPTEA